MPTLNSHTHCQAAQGSRTSQNLSISVPETRQERQKRKHERTKRYIVYGSQTSVITLYSTRCA